MPLHSRLAEVNQADIEQLIAEQTQEGPHLEFKREFPGVWDSGAKHEFLERVMHFC